MVVQLNYWHEQSIRSGISEMRLKRSYRNSSHGAREAILEKKSNKSKQNSNIQRIYAKGRKMFANKKLTEPTRIPGMKINGKSAIAVPRRDGKFNIIGARAQSRDGKNYGLAIYFESGRVGRMQGKRTVRIQKVYSMIKSGGGTFKKGSTGSRGG